MKNWLKAHWPEVLVLGVIFGVLLTCAAPGMTWVNTDSDGVHYVYSAKYLYPAHKTSAPLFLLIGHMFLWLPVGTEFWRMALISVIASVVSAWFIYAIIIEKLANEKRSKLYGIIGALVFGGSALVVSQSTIVETYALVTMFGLGAYYFAVKGKWLWCAIMLGGGVAVHHLILIPLIVMLIFFKGLRKWKYGGVMSAFMLFYLYIPISTAVNNPPNMWGNQEFQTFLVDSMSTGLMLIGGLSIWDIPKRIFDTLGIVGISLGLALIPIGYFLIRRKWYKEPLAWLFIGPIVYYMTDLAPQTYVYAMPAIGFGAVAAGIGLSKMRHQWKWVVLVGAVGLMAFNANYFDIGRTLDPELSARQYYVEELDKVPDGQILMPLQGWEWAAVFSYNKEYGRSIRPIYTGTLVSAGYQELLKEQGINLDSPTDDTMTLGEAQDYIAASILAKNEDVWITMATTPETYGARVLRADGYEDTLLYGKATVMDTVKWKPYNPYGIITGAVEVEEWIYIVLSNYSILTFTMLGVIGLVPVWIGWNVVVKKKRWSLRKKHKEVVNNV